MMKSGLVSISFRNNTIDEIIAAVKKAQLDSIEWGGDVHVPHGDIETAKVCAKKCQAEGIEISAYGSYLRFDHVLDPENAPDLTQKTLHSASALNAPTIRIWAGSKGSELTTSSEREQLTHAFSKFADQAQSEGIRIGLEYHGDTLTDSPESAIKLVNDLNHPNVDLYWQPTTGKDFHYSIQALHKVLPYVTNIHCFQWGLSGFHEKYPIRNGAKEWVAYLEVLNSVPKDRYISLEFIHDGNIHSLEAEAETLNSWIK